MGENLKVRQVESPSILVARHSRGRWEGGEEARECTVRGWIRKIVGEKKKGERRDDRTNQRPHRQDHCIRTPLPTILGQDWKEKAALLPDKGSSDKKGKRRRRWTRRRLREPTTHG